MIRTLGVTLVLYLLAGAVVSAQLHPCDETTGSTPTTGTHFGWCHGVVGENFHVYIDNVLVATFYKWPPITTANSSGQYFFQVQLPKRPKGTYRVQVRAFTSTKTGSLSGARYWTQP